jgi:hypothetical protein
MRVIALLPILGGKMFSFSTVDISFVFFVNNLYQLRKFLSIPGMLRVCMDILP